MRPNELFTFVAIVVMIRACKASQNTTTGTRLARSMALINIHRFAGMSHRGASLLLVSILLIGCDTTLTTWGEPRPPEPEEENQEIENAEPDESLATWLDQRELLLAPWTHRIDGELADEMDVESDRLRFPETENREILDWRRNDLVWSQSATPGKNVLRRVTSVVREEDQIVVFTIPARLDGLLLKGRLDTATDSGTITLGEDLRIDERLCQVYPEDAVAGCDTFSELYPDGNFIDPPPGRIDAIVYRHRFEPAVQANFSTVAIVLETEFDLQNREKCGCIARLYPDFDGINGACALGVEPGRVFQEVDSIKGSCRGDVTKFDLKVEGEFEIQLDELRWESDNPNGFEFTGVFAAEEREVITLPLDEGYLELGLEIRAQLDTTIEDSTLLSFQPVGRGPAVRVSSLMEASYPRSANDRRITVSASGEFDRDLAIWAAEPEIGGTKSSEVNLTVDLRAETRLWGTVGPTLVPLGVQTKASIQNEREGDDQSPTCPIELQGGARGAIAFPQGMPFDTAATLENVYSLYDSCGDDEGWEYCQSSVIDPCAGL